jgi:hypothetical protein
VVLEDEDSVEDVGVTCWEVLVEVEMVVVSASDDVGNEVGRASEADTDTSAYAVANESAMVRSVKACMSARAWDQARGAWEEDNGEGRPNKRGCLDSEREAPDAGPLSRDVHWMEMECRRSPIAAT